MKKLSLIIVVFAVLCISGASALGGPFSYNYKYKIDVDGNLTTPYSWAIVETFNNAPALDQTWTWTGYGHVVSGSNLIQDGGPAPYYAAPYNAPLMPGGPDQTQYYATPLALEEGQEWAMVDFGTNKYNYLGLFWGSADNYNTFEFLNGDVVVMTLLGSDLFFPANGNQSAQGQNQYVNFYNIPEFDAVRFTSTGYAFELDNLAVGVVPVPGALLIGLIGMGIAGLKLRKFA